ncbi:MAG TPA: hypothetical protein VNY09_03605 [Candidatus Sulfotelmatobacter sp.]|nr:hypothetical protein [Candidatus Sulfotelmatobacter sp.]
MRVQLCEPHLASPVSIHGHNILNLIRRGNGSIRRLGTQQTDKDHEALRERAMQLYPLLAITRPKKVSSLGEKSAVQAPAGNFNPVVAARVI